MKTLKSKRKRCFLNTCGEGKKQDSPAMQVASKRLAIPTLFPRPTGALIVITIIYSCCYCSGHSNSIEK